MPVPSTLFHYLTILGTQLLQAFRQWTKPNRTSLAHGALSDFTRSKSELILENALLRQQLIVLERQVKRPQLTWRERGIMVFLSGWLKTWKETVLIVQPGTIPLEPDLGRADHLVRKPHIRNLLATSQVVFEQELERVLGRERAQQILIEREERLLDERYPARERHDLRRRIGMARDVAAVLSVMRAEKQRRKRNGQRRRTANVSLYMRYWRREEGLGGAAHALADRAAHRAEQARQDELQRQERLRQARRKRREREPPGA